MRLIFSAKESTMLVLTRRVGDQIQIGDHILVTVVHLTGGGVRLGVEAPRDTPIVRRRA